MKKRLLLWGVAVVGGLAVVGRYQATEGRIGEPQTDWPAECALTRDPSRFTLVMFAHPLCPCTRASIGELARIMTHSQGRIDAVVSFVRPDPAPADWEHSENRDRAAEVPGVRVEWDPQGRRAVRFRAATSGHVVLYDREGRLVFHGGITPSRGHAGDNAGAEAIVALINGDQPRVPSTPVFGCPLSDP